MEKPQVSSLDQKTFLRLTVLYILALSAIAATILISQYMIQGFLNKQLDDSHIVNVAGRQRMLSQKLSKELLLLAHARDSLSREEAVAEIRITLDQWMAAHTGLWHGNAAMALPGQNSPAIHRMFDELAPVHDAMVSGARQVLTQLAPDINSPYASLEAGIHQVLAHERMFLQQMDQIVFTYDEEARAKVDALKRIEFFLLCISLLIILLELLFLFRPAARQVRNTLSGLIHAEKQATALAREMEDLYRSLRQSLQDLSAMNFALDQAAFFASLNTEGEINYISEKFCRLLHLDRTAARGKLSALFSRQPEEQARIEEYIQTAAGGSIWTGITRLGAEQHNGDPIWMEMSIIPIQQEDQITQVLILSSDITERKAAEREVERLNKDRFERQIRAQKIKTGLIVEAQEEERKRIARDLHDEIGQMLTGLKFKLESIDLTNPNKASLRLQELKEITLGLIRGVRIVTFNLTPDVLSDYGLAAGLKKLSAEIGKLTGKNILFENKTDFNQRLNSMAETNLYRIAQEAINNAIKYANASFILVSISHSPEMLSVVVTDDGVGFDLEAHQKTDPLPNLGMGIAFMKERVNFINGKLFINASPGKGVRISVNMPIDNSLA